MHQVPILRKTLGTLRYKSLLLQATDPYSESKMSTLKTNRPGTSNLLVQAVARSSGIAGGGRSISHTAQPADKEGRRRVEQMELERWLRLLRKPQCSGEAVSMARRCMVATHRYDERVV